MADLDLAGAQLIDFTMTGVRIRTAVFNGATFTGEAVFGKATFASEAWFAKAYFERNAWFGNTTFNGDAWFREAVFAGDAWSRRATFTGDATFSTASVDDKPFHPPQAVTRHQRELEQIWPLRRARVTSSACHIRETSVAGYC
ncbi:pentapeptide repeat-containing protein [Amycolatopsis sp. lyj-112]|uniref:pentapeptide repeat-containing protein n=1 Tax=Amycolatopsis sp. lyj-112 TaxID=2789288 RepID=UPI003977F839